MYSEQRCSKIHVSYSASYSELLLKCLLFFLSLALQTYQ